MTESFDLYAGVFTVTKNPWGANVSYQLHEPHPVQQRISQPARLGTTRMSIEHLKAMTFMFRRQILQHEQSSGLKIQVPIQVLNQLGIAMEDWEAFWQEQGG